MQVLTVMDRDSVEAVAPSPCEITVTYPRAPPNALIDAAARELEQARPFRQLHEPLRERHSGNAAHVWLYFRLPTDRTL